MSDPKPPVPNTWMSRLRDRWFGEPEAAQAPVAIELPPELNTLVEALESPQVEVRRAAAQALGDLGDTRAVQPLLAALRRCFRGGNARYQRYLGVAAVAVLVVLALGLVTGVVALKAFGAIGGMVNLGAAIVRGYLKRSRANSPVVQAITGALARIAEQNPTPELSTAVADLQAVAADAVHQDRQTRATSREAAEKIEALTERIKNLPLIAAPPERGTADLPLPAQPAEPTAEELPRVRL